MFIWRCFKGLFCKCKCNASVTQETTSIDEKYLTRRDEGEGISQIPDDEFVCVECSNVPEILEIHSDTGNLSMRCSKHGIRNNSSTGYLNKLIKSGFTYFDNKCSKCEHKPRKKETTMKFCTECREPFCEKCITKYHMEHKVNNYLIPIGEKNNVCKKHRQEKAENYCFDCEEIICEKDENHSDHGKINTKNLQNEANKYRKIIEDKNKTLFNMIRFYRLIMSSKDEESKKKVIESIEKENKRNEFDIDLAIYYLNKGKKEKEKKKEIELLIS